MKTRTENLIRLDEKESLYLCRILKKKHRLKIGERAGGLSYETVSSVLGQRRYNDQVIIEARREAAKIERGNAKKAQKQPA